MSLKVVTAFKARQNFGTIMNAVSFKNDQYIVERKGYGGDYSDQEIQANG